MTKWAGLGLLFAVMAAAMLHSGPLLAQQEEPDFKPPRTSWGDPDFRGTWPIQQVNDAGIPLQRPAAMGQREWLTEEEFAERIEKAEQSDAAFVDDVKSAGTRGLADWLRTTQTGRRSSLIVEPADGRLPPLTPEAQTLFEAGRSSWKEGQAFDRISDFDAFDRCITRGFPAMMLPKPYNNGVRIFQSPGFVVLQLEMFGTRIVSLEEKGGAPGAVRGWNGLSRGRWEGDALVIETANIVAGDSATDDITRRAASPLPNRNFSTLPMGAGAHTVERLTLSGLATIAYEITYTDPDVFTAPWTVAFEWTRDDDYRMFEYACHEGNEHIRNVIETSRASRLAQTAGQNSR